MGFTLIELLVVISIIGLLIALLLPALSAARKSAQQIKCMSNEKQIYVGIVAYAFEHDDIYPTRETTGAFQYRMAPGMKTPGLSRALPETFGLAGVLDKEGYISGQSGVWICDAQPDHQQQNGNTYAYVGKRTGTKQRFEPNKLADHDYWVSSGYAATAWMLYDNFMFKPYTTGWYASNGTTGGFLVPQKDRWSPHPIKQSGTRTDLTKAKFSVNMLYYDGHADLHELDYSGN